MIAAIIVGILVLAGIITTIILVIKSKKEEPEPTEEVYSPPVPNEPIVSPNDLPRIEPTKDSMSEEDLWNGKWERKPITYSGRTIRPYTNISGWGIQTRTDVRSFILENDEIMLETIARYNLKGKTNDETMMNIQKFICEGKNIGGYPEFKPLQYKSDTSFNKSYEFWQFPFETMQEITVKWNKYTEEFHLAYEDETWKDLLKDAPTQYERFGDCEDGAILIASLAINAGIPAYRIKVAAGDVSNREYLKNLGYSGDDLENNVSEGGHAYCIYLAECDDNWRIIDWCYYADPWCDIASKPLAKNGGYGNCYGATWFTFNNQFAWNQTSLDILAPKIEGLENKNSLTKKVTDHARA